MLSQSHTHPATSPGVRAVLLTTLVMALLTMLPTPANAWGVKGHAAVGALAEANLSPAAREQVAELLQADLDRHEKPSGRTTLASVASWPDEIRDEAQKTDPKAYKGWHVRENPVCQPATLAPCKDGHCADQLIIHYTAILKDDKQDHRARNEALKWLVHLVGDLHQPLHAGVNANGGSVAIILAGRDLDPKAATLHHAWDVELAEAALKGWKSTATLPAKLEPLPADAPTQWMIETREVALHDAYQTMTGFNCDGKLPTPILLDAAYQQHSIGVVRQQIERAGLRLAQLLNQTLDPH